ncbi:MAG: aldolase catalytic domain-containing protein [Eisenbergiella sp.]|nr:aldolase catalytic domain-containing protein [Bacillota bacterium]
MAEINLLDCTLRDGGYINDWNFGYETIKSIINKLVASEVEYVEIGFLRNCEYDKNRSVFNNCEQMKNILPMEHGKTKFSAMALHNTYDVNKLEPYDGKTIDLIRVTFHDYDIDEGLEFIRKVKEKGYKVACNPINIMGYSDAQILELLKKVNELKPYGFSIVDTFGSMMKGDLLRIYSMIENNLDKSVVIGLHLHENLALAYSLAQEYINIKAYGRESIIDASMLGMGRVPGNLCMELIMDYMNKMQGRNYNVNPVLDGIDDHIIQLKQIESWGYNIAYALSAKYNLHRNYSEFLLGTGKLRAKQINQILSQIVPDKKTAFDKSYIEKLYLDFQSIQTDDVELMKKLEKELGEKKVLIIAPGASIRKYREQIDAFREENRPITFSANFVPDDYDVDYAFLSNARRYETYRDKKNENQIIVTSNLLNLEPETCNVVNYSDVSFSEKGICDNCVIMLLRMLAKIGKKQVYLAGFDGYQENGVNYVNAHMASLHTKGEEENVSIRRYVKELEEKMQLEFLTPSRYED